MRTNFKMSLEFSNVKIYLKKNIFIRTKQIQIQNYIIYLFTGYEDASKFIVPRDRNYFTRRTKLKSILLYQIVLDLLAMQISL